MKTHSAAGEWERSEVKFLQNKKKKKMEAWYERAGCQHLLQTAQHKSCKLVGVWALC